jgi:hypothetical protein
VQTVVELVYSIAQGILYTIPLYAMIGYEWKADKFFYFLFFLTCCFLYFSLFGAMLVTCTPSAMLASIVVSFSLTGWNIFAGFLVPRPVGISISVSPRVTYFYTTQLPIRFPETISLLQALPIWWRWFYWCNPVSWTIYGVTASQFGDVGRNVTATGSSTGTVVVKEFLDQTLGMKHDFLGYVVLAHFGYILLFVFLFAYGTKALNFQKR